MKKISKYNFFVTCGITLIIIGFLIQLKFTKFLPMSYSFRIAVYAVGHILLSLTLIFSYVFPIKSLTDRKEELWKLPAGVLFGLAGIFNWYSPLKKFQVFITAALILYFGMLYLGYIRQKRIGF